MSTSTPPTVDAIPRHLRQPGEEGYRTPVVEDPEHPAHPRQRNVQAARSAPGRAFNHFALGALQTSFDSSSKQAAHNSEKNHESDRCYLPEGFPERLNWRQRIKHVTWAYFTLTMATGGNSTFSISSRVAQ
jgi:hypothetical protein